MFSENTFDRFKVMDVIPICVSNKQVVMILVTCHILRGINGYATFSMNIAKLFVHSFVEISSIR